MFFPLILFNYNMIHFNVVVVVVILVIIIIIVVKRKRRSRNISTLATAAAQAADNITYEMQPKKDETVKNKHYAKPITVKANNIYANPTNHTYDKPAGSCENSTNYENLLTEKGHVYDTPKAKKTSTSNLMRRKESSSKYERLSIVDEPGDDP